MEIFEIFFEQSTTHVYVVRACIDKLDNGLTNAVEILIGSLFDIFILDYLFVRCAISYCLVV